MELTAYRDGIFSSSDPIAAPGLTSFSNGSLGSLLTSYNDGSLGATSKVLSPQKCINWCMSVRSPTMRRGCIRACSAGRRARSARSMSGLGDLPTNIVIGGAAVAAVALVLMLAKKKKRR